ncbi:MAG: 2-hydroxymuconic semialdehyde dehydrogenase [Rhodothalassiaceae bacterium]
MTTNRRILNFIDGHQVEGGGRWFEDINPADGEVVAEVSEATAADVDAAVRAAKRALAGPWGKRGVEERAALLHKVADGVMARLDDFVAAEMADTGKPLMPTRMGEIPRAAGQFRVFAEIGRVTPMEMFESAMPDGRRALNLVHRVPRGVVAAICPWNLPFMLLTWKVAPALICGNTVVVKPSEETPATAALLGEVMAAAGVPAGVYNVVHGFGPDSAGAFLTTHPGVDAITFTGETKTGEAIMRAASVGTRGVSLELGGKNAGVVFADCDFAAAVAGETRAAFHNCGQICLGNERLYVERPIFERFVAALAEAARGLRMGDPMDKATQIGPLISRQHREKVLGYMEKARAAGAEVHAGGGVPELGDPYDRGAWIEPTVWTGMAEDAAPVREEIFGPCVHVAPFDDEDEVRTLVNDSPYGLTATLWTRDLDRVHRLAPALEVGVVWVNEWMVRDLRTGFGGTKGSGIGREGGAHSLHFYSETRNVCIRT